MDFIDENEDNPLFCKNLDMRAKVEAVNKAAVKAIPSMDSMVLDEDECDVCLSREQIISKYLKQNKNAVVMRDVPDEEQQLKTDIVRCDELQNEIDDSPAHGKMDNQLTVNRDVLPTGADDDDKENFDLQSIANRRAEVNSRKVASFVGDVDCLAAQGDGSQCDPNKDELLMAKLIKCAAANCSEYFNPITGETILLEEGDTKTMHSMPLRPSSRNNKKDNSKPNRFSSEENERLSVHIDIRTKTSSPQLHNKGRILSDKSHDECSDFKDTLTNNEVPNNTVMESLKMSENPNDLSSASEPLSVMLSEDQLKIFEMDMEPVFLPVKESIQGSSNVSLSAIPRSCILDNAAEDSSPNCMQKITCTDLSSDLTNVIYKIQLPSPLPLNATDDMNIFLLGDSNNCMESKKENSASCSVEATDTIDSAWDWVSAIPRAYYADDDYLAECVSGLAVRLETTLDCRLLNETFKLSNPPSSAMKDRESARGIKNASSSSKNELQHSSLTCTDSDSLAHHSYVVENRHNETIPCGKNLGKNSVSDAVFETPENIALTASVKTLA